MVISSQLKNADPDKYVCTHDGTGLGSRSGFLLPDVNMGNNVIIYHINNKGKYILILGQVSTQGLDDSTLSAEAQFSFNFSRSNRKFCLSLHYNGSNSFLFANTTKIYQFKAKDSEKKNIPCVQETFQEIFQLIT